ncbi:amine oxidase [Belliella sp. DSM 111904]|uniref:Amine oxidase n=1 Tax=Belliella filtrata TaxID=2923435 RepID=A0ABS9UWK3_9BACT|nr:amine oxidase [Belliella filtrata]MCH7408433.1 amine oxidase [Belliella filtrata]
MKDFKSILMGGFECADHINIHGERVNLLKETAHDIRVLEDYMELKKLGIYTVREGLCWSNVEYAPGCYNFGEVLSRIQAADKLGIQQIWDIIHFGYPDDLYPSHPQFCRRFVNLCLEFCKFFKANSDQELHLVPINEIGFLSWLSGEVASTAPFLKNNGWEMKYKLCEAAILGIKCVRKILPSAFIYLVEPLVWVHHESSEDFQSANQENSYQYQAMDIILGRICPELGGNSSLVDGLGFNYYWNCQWEINSGPLPWPDLSNKRKRLSALLLNSYARYDKPLFISETGHIGIGRTTWFEEIIEECLEAVYLGVDLRGICLYPVIDRPDWDDLSCFHNSGIFDLDKNKNRLPYQSYYKSIKEKYNLVKEVIIETNRTS